MGETPPRGVVVVDFDGTICEHRYPYFGEPLAGAREGLQRLKAAGFRIIIHTVRTSSHFKDIGMYDPEVNSHEAVQTYLETHDMPFDEIWVHDKPNAVVYLDDRCVRVVGDSKKSNWKKIIDALVPRQPSAWERRLWRWLS
jgi:hypothetical protein